MEASGQRNHEVATSRGRERAPSGGHTLLEEALARFQREGRTRERVNGTTPREDAAQLVEDGWNVFIECLLLRDGLLQACEDVEHAMESLRGRLAALPVAPAPSNENGAASVPGPATGATGDLRARVLEALVTSRPVDGSAAATNGKATNGKATNGASSNGAATNGARGNGASSNGARGNGAAH